jgi:uncharacterized protein YehS (DUF1456 family)
VFIIFNGCRKKKEITMINNDVLRRIRYVFDYADVKMLAIFAEAGATIDRETLSDWLRKEEDPDFSDCSDKNLAYFLNGLIVEKRGKRDGPTPEPESHLTNNMILMKLKIAFNLQADDMIEILSMSKMKISKHELSALFRKPGHKHYRECMDQLLRNFISGITKKYRTEKKSE